MCTTTRPLRTLLPLLLVALFMVAAPAPTHATVPATAAPFTDQVIVILNPTTTAGIQIASSPTLVAESLSAETGTSLAYVRPFSAESHILKLSSPRPYAEVEAIAQQLAATPGVLAATPDAILFPTREPSDPGYSTANWHLWPPTASNYGANLPPAWDITTGAPSIVTAVIDTGGLLTHEDLAGRTPAGNPGYDMLADVARANDGNGRDPDPSDPGDWVTDAESAAGTFRDCMPTDSSWHGSHVAGTIGARANNGKGIAGINWVSPVLVIRALGKCGGYTSDIVDGMRWAVGLPVTGLPTNPTPARVINLSLGGSSSTCDTFFQTAINAVNAAGAVVVVAAGNEDADVTNAQPANCNGVITVAASARDGSRAIYSNYGSLVEIAAPGGDSLGSIYSTINSGTHGPVSDAYGNYQGTSMATPHVAGIVSLMLSANPSLTPAQVLQIIQATATPFPAGSDCSGICGAGIINAGAAVEGAARLIRTVSFQTSSSTAAEGGPAVSLPVKLNIASNQAVSVPFTVGGTAQSSDHTLTAGTLTFAPGQTSASLDFSIVDDYLIEGDETVVITLGSAARTGLGAVGTDTVTIKDNDSTPSISLTPTSLNFGEQPVSTGSLSRTVTISNPGVLPLTISGIGFSTNTDFARAGGSCPTTAPFTVISHTVCTLDLTFTPTRLGLRNSTLVITSNVAGSPQSVALSGTGTIPAIGFGPTSLSFADQIVGTSSPSQSLTLTNPGTAPLKLNAVATSSDYLVVSTTCAQAYPATLAPGASCTITLSFTPQASGAHTGTLTVTSDVPGGPYSVRLSGTGLAPTLTLDASGLNFGGQHLGAPSTPRTVTVSNRGSAALTISALSVTGATFARTNDSCLSINVAPGASCTVTVAFTPTITGTYTGTLTITSNAPDSPASVSLTGVGTAGPAASLLLTPPSLAFGAQTVPALAATQRVTISNQGDAALSLSGITVAGTGFAAADSTCGALPQTLAPSATCIISVSLTMTTTSAYSGTLTVTSDADGGPQVVPLTGSGVTTATTNTFTITQLVVGGTPITTSVSFTLSRSGTLSETTSISYSLIAVRTSANANLPLAVNTVSFTPGMTTTTVSLSLNRLSLYGVTEVLLSLDPTANKGTPVTLRATVPPAWYTTYIPLIVR